jgi:hypothetical protein
LKVFYNNIESTLGALETDPRSQPETPSAPKTQTEQPQPRPKKNSHTHRPTSLTQHKREKIKNEGIEPETTVYSLGPLM